LDLRQKLDAPIVPSAENLMLFMAHLHQFQRRPSTHRIPSRLFWDSESLLVILQASLDALGTAIGSVHWQTQGMDLVKLILDALESKGLYSHPVIYLADSIDQMQKQALKSLCSRRICRVVSDMSIATHIIEDLEPPSQKYRTVERCDGFEHRHTWSRV
jgi:hypothetical protein